MRGVHSRNLGNTGIVNLIHLKSNRAYNEKDRCYEIEKSNITARILAKSVGERKRERVVLPRQKREERKEERKEVRKETTKTGNKKRVGEGEGKREERRKEGKKARNIPFLIKQPY